MRREAFKEAAKNFRSCCNTGDELDATLAVIRTLINSNDIDRAEELLSKISISRKLTPVMTRLEYFDLSSRLAYYQYHDEEDAELRKRHQKDMVRHARTAINIGKEELRHLSEGSAIEMAGRLRSTYQNLARMTNDLSYKKEAKVIILKYKLHTMGCGCPTCGDRDSEMNRFLCYEKRIRNIVQSNSESVSDFDEMNELLDLLFSMTGLHPEDCKYSIYHALFYLNRNSEHFESDELFLKHLHQMREFGSAYNFYRCEEVALEDMIDYYSCKGMSTEECDARRALLNLRAHQNGACKGQGGRCVCHCTSLVQRLSK